MIAPADTDYQALLPHFTVKLLMELECRLTQRILDENWEELKTWPTWWNPDTHLPAEAAHDLAHQIVRRMYRTQLKEARAMQSFAQAWLDYQQPQIEEKIKLLPDGPANKLKMMFSKSTERE